MGGNGLDLRGNIVIQSMYDHLYRDPVQVTRDIHLETALPNSDEVLR